MTKVGHITPNGEMLSYKTSIKLIYNFPAFTNYILNNSRLVTDHDMTMDMKVIVQYGCSHSGIPDLVGILDGALPPLTESIVGVLVLPPLTESIVGVLVLTSSNLGLSLWGGLEGGGP